LAAPRHLGDRGEVSVIVDKDRQAQHIAGQFLAVHAHEGLERARAAGQAGPPLDRPRQRDADPEDLVPPESGPRERLVDLRAGPDQCRHRIGTFVGRRARVHQRFLRQIAHRDADGPIGDLDADRHAETAAQADQNRRAADAGGCVRPDLDHHPGLC
jgi:hypothetical protein